MKRILLSTAISISLIASAFAGNPYTAIGNANYSALPSDIRLVPTVAISSARTITLPSASGTVVGSGTTVPGGISASGNASDRFEIIDMFGNIGGSNNCLNITAQSGDTINGVSGGTVGLCNPFGRIALRPIGGVGWVVDSNEVVTSTVASGSAVSLTTNTAANITSVSLTPGEWDCRGVVARVITGTTSFTYATSTISTTTTVTPSTTTLGNGATAAWSSAATVPGTTIGMTTTNPPVRFSLAATTTVYLGAYDTFTASTDAGYGTLTCRRAL